MDLFHLIDDAHCILTAKGVYRQAKVYRRGKDLYAAVGNGFVRLYANGTSIPGLRLEATSIPGHHYSPDVHGRLVLD